MIIKEKSWFYTFIPKDNTPGCTNEACSFRDNYNEMIAKGFEVVGVSGRFGKVTSEIRRKI